ncbi:MAG: DHA2 family efflux MFS transporter permease subunit [Caulobacteraceae bacterium]
MNPAIPSAGDVPNKAFITASIMLAALMQTLDTTIANVALPHIQGSLSASQDQIVWVLTSYIVAAAIMTPLTGWLSDRFGIKTVFLCSVAGFTVASMLCGAAQSLNQMVIFRLLQGVAGAALMPLTQAVLFTINPPERYGRAMGTFGMAVILGPLLGPVLGGWLTENYSWRWVFYINLPIGAAALFGIWTFLPGRGHTRPPKFDFFGFGSLALAIGALQLLLDRGQGNDWFDSRETWIEVGVMALAAYLFVIHTYTAERPFFSRALLADRNFISSTVASFFIMGVLFGSLALVPPMMQHLYGYPVLTTGIVTMPRGVGTLLSMVLVGRLVSKVDPRWLIGTGLVICAHSYWAMSQFNLQMGSWPFIWTGFEQGVSMGLVFVPLSAIGFGTLPGSLRVEGTTVYNIVRNIGGSVGISAMTALLTQNSQRFHANLAAHVRPDNPLMKPPYLPHGMVDSPAGLQALNGVITREATFMAYLNDFWLMAIVMILLVPGLLLMRKPVKAAAPAVAME